MDERLIENETNNVNNKNEFLPDGKVLSTDLFKIVKFESVTEREKSISKLSFGGRSPTKMPTELIHLADEDESGLLI